MCSESNSEMARRVNPQSGHWGPLHARNRANIGPVDFGPERGDPTPFECAVEGSLVGEPGVGGER
jgi:hypothetical protein